MKVSASPHVRDSITNQSLMLDVIIALAPSAAAGVYFFGGKALITILFAVAAAVGSEYLWSVFAKRKNTVKDLSAAVTGLLIGLILPPSVPWWMPLIASAFAIIIVKQLFGGLGDNFLNPALTARAVLLASWPAIMNVYYTSPRIAGADAVTAATPLANCGYSLWELLSGQVPGSIGEVCKIAILLGFAYLMVRKVITWHIPVTYCVVFAVTIFALNGFVPDAEPLRQLLSGGVLFGAIFMATDYVTSPMTAKGKLIYAAGCGIITALIRKFGGYPEGVTYAILIMNIATPLIDRLGRRVFGTKRRAI